MSDMITDKGEIVKYLEDLKAGRIKQGLKIGVPELDDHIRFKAGTFNMIHGHDNTGKTYWRLWWYLCLSVKHGCKWNIWTGENKAGQVVRDLIKMLSGQSVQELDMKDVYDYEQRIGQWFTFIQNDKLHTFKDLLKAFEDNPSTGCLIDPYTGLDRKYGHSDNYEFLNQTREWTNRTGITIDVCLHPSTASGRANAVYPDNHKEWAGQLRKPLKADCEGGKPFNNRSDDWITVHRFVNHPTLKYYTMIYNDKNKDDETGGGQTDIDCPILCEFNNGRGFTIAGINPLHPKGLIPNGEFEVQKDELYKTKDDAPF